MSDQLYCPECAAKWSGAYNTDHRCVTCGSPLKAEEVNGELERVRAERDALAAHVDRLREALSQSLTAWGYEASQGDGIMEEHGSVYEECNKRCDEPAATSLARLKAQWQAEACEALSVELTQKVDQQIARHRGRMYRKLVEETNP